MTCRKHNHLRTSHLCAYCLLEERKELASLVNSLANIVIDGDISSNDLDVANDAIDRVVDLLEGDRQWIVIGTVTT